MGDGDPSRYMTPGSSIELPAVPPFVEVDIEEMTMTGAPDDGVARMRVAADVETAGGVEPPVAYTIDLAEREGRWEVVALSGRPSAPVAPESDQRCRRHDGEPAASTHPGGDRASRRFRRPPSDGDGRRPTGADRTAWAPAGDGSATTVPRLDARNSCRGAHIRRPGDASSDQKGGAGRSPAHRDGTRRTQCSTSSRASSTDFTNLVQLGIGLLALVFVGMTWARTRSLAPTLGALVLGAVVVWGVNNMPILQREVDEDITEQGA